MDDNIEIFYDGIVVDHFLSKYTEFMKQIPDTEDAIADMRFAHYLYKRIQKEISRLKRKKQDITEFMLCTYLRYEAGSWILKYEGPRKGYRDILCNPHCTLCLIGFFTMITVMIAFIIYTAFFY